MGANANTRDTLVRAYLSSGLDSRAPYLSRLSARSALYTDLQLLLDDNTAPLSPADYRRLVLQQNCLARSSDSARLKLWKELKNRYILNREEPLFLAFWQEWRRCSCEAERGLLAYIFLALSDRLVTDLGLNWLFSYLRKAPMELRVVDVLNFIDHAAQRDHSEVKGWTGDTRLHVAQHYMASIRDFGLARGKFRKVSVRPALYGSPVRLLITALRLAGKSDLEIVTGPVFRLLALEGIEVIDALGELNRRGELSFRMQGDVIELGIAGAE
jgi:hypothetical protein